ncbi:MAG: hypothetical protein AB1714_00720 [Acidobacteriota bacterium]
MRSCDGIASAGLAILLIGVPTSATSEECSKLFARTSPEEFTERLAPNVAVDPNRLSFPVLSASDLRTVAVVAIVPTEEVPFKNVFGHEAVYSQTRADELLEAKQNLLSTFAELRFLENTGGDEVLRKAIANAPAKIVLIIGHNAAGILRLPDGSGLGLLGLAREATKQGKLPIFLSCNSREHVGAAPGVGSAITFREATDIAQKLQTWLAGVAGIRRVDTARGQSLVPSLVEALQVEIDRAIARPNVRVLVNALVEKSDGIFRVVGLVLVLCMITDECPSILTFIRHEQR